MTHMSDVPSSFVPAELLGDHYRSIGGSYGSFELALSAVEHHYNNKHGGGGVFRIFRPDETHGTAALIEGSASATDPYVIRSIYKIIVSSSGH